MINIFSRDQLSGLRNVVNNIIIDVSYNSTTRTSYLSPYYSWGNIPVPFSSGLAAESVMSIWEGLKVFELSDIDKNIFFLRHKDRLLRSGLGLGNLRGYRRGTNYDYIYEENEAYQRIFIPTYRWVLEHKAFQIIQWLRHNYHKDIIIVDNIEEVIPNQITPATLIKAYVLGASPFKDVIQQEIIHHYFCGRKVLSWYTVKYRFKSIPPETSISQDGILEFDFE